jgi:hypothetical protein
VGAGKRVMQVNDTKIHCVTGSWWLTPGILATQEEEIRRIKVKALSSSLSTAKKKKKRYIVSVYEASIMEPLKTL